MQPIRTQPPPCRKRGAGKLIEGLLWGVSIASLGYCGWFYGQAWYQQWRASAALQDLWNRTTPGAGRASNAPAPTSAAIPEGRPIARIDIPRLHISSVVFEGTGDTTLDSGIGHWRGSALPGPSGNTVLAGHRDTFFRPLRNIRDGDVISIKTGAGDFRYVVESTEVVTPERTDVLNPTSSATLTLITCFPFRFIGSAPDRFIVHGRAVGPPALYSRTDAARPSSFFR